jgi:hypothetical protein
MTERKCVPIETRSLTETLEAVREYVRKGWAVIPIPSGNKGPRIDGWQNLRLAEANLSSYFAGVSNVGILLGEPSGGLTDVDLDCLEAIAVADFFLPQSDSVFGRASKPRSHRFYRVTPSPAYFKFCDPLREKEKEGRKDSTLVELRQDAHQTLVPPSEADGEIRSWDRNGEPGRADAETLSRAVARVAAAALMARNWPTRGERHDASLALAGTLLRAGWAEEETRHFIAAVTTATHDEESRQRVRDTVSTAKRLASGRTATGAPTLAKILGEEVMERVYEWLQLRHSPSGSTTARQIHAPQWPDPLPKEAFHGLAGEIVQAIEPHTESDPAALLMQFLLAFGNAVGRSAFFQVEADQHFSNIFVLIVGATSKGRKGTAWAHIRRVFQRIDSAWANDRIQSGLSSGEGIIHAVRDRVEKTELDEEGIEKTRVIDEGVQDKRLLIFESEFAVPLRQIERSGNTLSNIIRDCWDRDRLQSLTKNSAERATGTHVAIQGHITKDELLRYMTTTEIVNGFANRFLFVCVKRSKILPEGGDVDSATLDSLMERLAAATSFARTAGKVVRDEAARKIWRSVYPELSEGRLGMLGAATSRAEAQVVRLSLLYALLDCSNAIRSEHMLAALAVWEYCDASARFIFGDALGDPVADAILQAVRETASGLTRTQIRDLLGRHRSEAEIERALAMLAHHGLVSKGTVETAGRSAERWKAIGVATKAT